MRIRLVLFILIAHCQVLLAQAQSFPSNIPSPQSLISQVWAPLNEVQFNFKRFAILLSSTDECKNYDVQLEMSSPSGEITQSSRLVKICVTEYPSQRNEKIIRFSIAGISTENSKDFILILKVSAKTDVDKAAFFDFKFPVPNGEFFMLTLPKLEASFWYKEKMQEFGPSHTFSLTVPDTRLNIEDHVTNLQGDAVRSFQTFGNWYPPMFAKATLEDGESRYFALQGGEFGEVTPYKFTELVNLPFNVLAPKFGAAVKMQMLNALGLRP